MTLFEIHVDEASCQEAALSKTSRGGSVELYCHTVVKRILDMEMTVR